MVVRSGVQLAAVVQHVQVLERSGVVTTEKVGRVRTCQLAPQGLGVAEDWLARRRALWGRRLDRLGETGRCAADHDRRRRDGPAGYVEPVRPLLHDQADGRRHGLGSIAEL